MTLATNRSMAGTKVAGGVVGTRPVNASRLSLTAAASSGSPSWKLMPSQRDRPLREGRVRGHRLGEVRDEAPCSFGTVSVS